MSKDTIKQGILEILSTDERARNSDTYLCWKFLREKAGVNIYIPFEDFARMPSFETIIRMRAQIQNDEQRFLPTDPEARKRRKINEEEWRAWLAKESLKAF